MSRTIQAAGGDQFYSPFASALVKGVEEDGKWNVYLQASNESRDQDSEVVFCKALKEAADYYLTHGVLSWDHKHKQIHDPQYIIGEPSDVAFTDRNETLVKGFLYKENKISQGLWQNILSGAKKLGASVGGGIIQKVKGSAGGVKGMIMRVIWDETAITHKPVNDGTLGHVSIIPFAQFAKALMAGDGVNAEAFTGGRALTPESLQGSELSDTFNAQGYSIPYGELRRVFDALLAAITSGKVKSYNDVMEFILSRGYPSNISAELIQYITRKLPTIQNYFGG